MSGGIVSLRREGTVGVITLERPDKLNSLAGDMRTQLRDAIVEAAGNSEIGALVITGAGRGFCAGGDVKAMAALHEQGSADPFHRILHAGAECVLALQAFPGLTVAAVNGVAAGAGFSLALACDLRIASQQARFAASWGEIGLAPDWGATFFLPQMIGSSRAAQLILGGRVLGAEDAVEQGLVLEVVPSDALLPRAVEIAAERGAATEMVRQVKYLLRRGIEGSLEASLAAETEAQEELFDGSDVAEGLAAFTAKRPPQFGRS